MRRKWFLATAWVSFLSLLLTVGAARGDSNDRAQGGGDPLGPRLKISLFRYAGAEEGEARTHFSRFKGILRDKITVLVEESVGSWPKLTYLNSLSLEPGGDEGFEDKLSSEAAVQSYWAGSRSLILLRGSMFTDSQRNYTARTRLFFGELRGALPRPSLSLNLPINEDQFSNTNDSHSLAIYYALAMDAARLRYEPSHVINLLSRAQDKIHDLSNRGSISPAVMEIQQAVDKAIAAQKSRVSKP